MSANFDMAYPKPEHLVFYKKYNTNKSGFLKSSYWIVPSQNYLMAIFLRKNVLNSNLSKKIYQYFKFTRSGKSGSATNPH
jgi:hypothetical protein